MTYDTIIVGAGSAGAVLAARLNEDPDHMPYFRRIENDEDFRDDFHDTDGPVVVRRDSRERWLPDHRAWYDACRAMGFVDGPDQNDPDVTGVGPFPFNSVDGVRWSTAIAYLNPTRERPNLTIMPDSLAHRVLFDGQRAVGIRAHSQGEPFTVMAEEVILAGGAIGSPHLLLLSGVGPTAQLAAKGIPTIHRLPGVGENLRDQP